MPFWSSAASLPRPGITPPSIPAELPAGRASTLIGARLLQYFVSNHGQPALLLIDPEASAAVRRIELPTLRVDFATAPLRPQLTEAPSPAV